MPKAIVMLTLDDERLTVILAACNYAQYMAMVPPTAAQMVKQVQKGSEYLATLRQALSTYPDAGQDWFKEFIVDQMETLKEIDQITQQQLNAALQNNPNLH